MKYMMETILFILLAFSGLVLSLFAGFTVIFRHGKKASGTSTGVYPFVSILKPIKSVDDGMAANLESFYALDYPAYEILFAVDDFEDPCVELLETMRGKYPDIPTIIIATGHPQFENPKVLKLARLESLSRGELFWATDSNVRVAPDTLRRLVDAHLVDGAKMVFSPIRGTMSRTFGSLMENLSLNFFSSGSIIASWALCRQQILVGKSFLVERAALRAFGGFDYFKNYLAEDFLMGEAFVKSGFRTSTNYTWVTNVNSSGTVKSYFKRMSRWAKLRFHLKRPIYFLEILANPVAISILILPLVGWRVWPIAAAAAAFKLVLEYVNFLFVNTGDRRSLRLHLLFPAAVLAKDLILFAVYLTPFFSRRVEWRSGKISIRKHTLINVPANVDNLVYKGA